jgi:hypothetical protein
MALKQGMVVAGSGHSDSAPLRADEPRCARAAYEMRLGVELTAELLKAIDAPAWTIRVYAAAALAPTPHLERAAETFFALAPARGKGSGAERASEIWSSLCVAFPPEMRVT